MFLCIPVLLRPRFFLASFLFLIFPPIFPHLSFLVIIISVILSAFPPSLRPGVIFSILSSLLLSVPNLFCNWTLLSRPPLLFPTSPPCWFYSWLVLPQSLFPSWFPSTCFLFHFISSPSILLQIFSPRLICSLLLPPLSLPFFFLSSVPPVPARPQPHPLLSSLHNLPASLEHFSSVCIVLSPPLLCSSSPAPSACMSVCLPSHFRPHPFSSLGLLRVASHPPPNFLWSALIYLFRSDLYSSFA